ncbi:hypothetical protein SynNOUM97013_01646 [Synechococcus sp. NOUM97013]|nr:hypothetical protein SynNOUM97013_01646 [Synechococcus sp. NOUM97013]
MSKKKPPQTRGLFRESRFFSQQFFSLRFLDELFLNQRFQRNG